MKLWLFRKQKAEENIDKSWVLISMLSRSMPSTEYGEKWYRNYLLRLNRRITRLNRFIAGKKVFEKHIGDI